MTAGNFIEVLDAHSKRYRCIAIAHIVSFVTGARADRDEQAANEVDQIVTVGGTYDVLFETQKSLLQKLNGGGGAALHGVDVRTRAAYAERLTPRAEAHPPVPVPEKVEEIPLPRPPPAASAPLLNIPGSPTPHEVLVGKVDAPQIPAEGATRPRPRPRA